jgi:hypothetical protein
LTEPIGKILNENYNRKMSLCDYRTEGCTEAMGSSSSYSNRRLG